MYSPFDLTGTNIPAYGFVLSHARFKESPPVVVVVVENDSFLRVRVSVLENAPVFLSRGAFSPTNARRYVTALTAALFENGATITDEPRRRHELLRNEAPHSHPLALVARIVDRAFYAFFLEPLKLAADEIDRFRRVYGRVIVHNLEVDTGLFCERHANGAIFSAAGRHNERSFVKAFGRVRRLTEPHNGILF